MTVRSRYGGAAAQLRLELDRSPVYDRELFATSGCNHEAAAAVDAWPDWPGGSLALVGPQGAGKTHLAQAWAARSGAFIVGDGPIDLMDLPAGPVLLEDADRREADTVLFHLINRAAAGASLLLTAREAPRRWAAALPDLRSRLNALRTVSLGAPDDVVLERVLVKLFRDRNIKPDPEVLAYLLRRMERSVPAAQALVDRLDKAADTSGRGVTRVLAREVLEAGEQAGDKLGEPFE